jgi:Fe-S cluster assembly protein SufD
MSLVLNSESPPSAKAAKAAKDAVVNGARALTAGPVLSPDVSEEWAQQRSAAWDLYQTLPLPKRKDEEWRFANVNVLDLSPYHVAATLPDGSQDLALQESQPMAEALASAVFLNDQSLSFTTLPKEWTDKGVIWESLESAWKIHPDLLRKHFMSNPSKLGSEKFAALHKAFSQVGSVLYVPKGVQVDKPFVVHHNITGLNSAVFPHTLVIAEENSRVFFLEYFRSLDQQPAFSCAVNDLIVAPGAQLDYLAVQLWSERTLSFQLGSTSVKKDASSKVFHVNIGGGFARVETHSQLLGSGARSEMLALTVAHDRQEFDQRTLQDHQAPHTWSDLLFKNTLNHRSKTIFKGLIKVEHGAFQTDAYQKNRNLLLHPEAEADSMPGLEIENDDVRCTHGATTGQIDEEELFYMQARGISPAIAKYLIGLGFCEEVLTRFGHESINESIRALIDAKFQRSGKVTMEVAQAEKIDETDLRSLQGTE